VQRSHSVAVNFRYYISTCLADTPLLDYWLPDGLERHRCELARGHTSLHVCWCGLAFNDHGEQFWQQALPGLEQRPAA
jgi:hypothetical protein